MNSHTETVVVLPEVDFSSIDSGHAFIFKNKLGYKLNYHIVYYEHQPYITSSSYFRDIADLGISHSSKVVDLGMAVFDYNPKNDPQKHSIANIYHDYVGCKIVAQSSIITM